MVRRYAKRVLKWLTGRDRPPEDPFSSVRQPVRRGPPSLSAGIALAEPGPPRISRLFGIRLPGR